jgi:phage baseplate assembly protein W
MNRTTGQPIARLGHIQQSIGDILTTRIGSRVMRRDYGSQLVDLIDHPSNGATLLMAYSAIVMALMRWEPRVRINQVQLSGLTSGGQCELTLDATLVDSNDAYSLKIPLSLGAAA